MEHHIFVRIWRWAQSIPEVALTFGITVDEAVARAQRVRKQGYHLLELPAEGPVRWFVIRFAEETGHVERFVDAWTLPYLTPSVLGISPTSAAEIAAWLRMLDVRLIESRRMPFVN